VARVVLRIIIRNAGGRVLGYGSGFLIGDGVLLTNNHVLPNSDVARGSEAEAFYEYGLLGEEAATERFALEPDKLFHTSKDLDFTIVAVAPVAASGRARLEDIGWLPLISATGKTLQGEWLTIIQHPRGERKQLCVRENQLIKCDTDVLWYSTDTLGGSSGSPVFNNDWLLVALHHSGVPKTVNGKWQTLDGRDYDQARDDESKIDWIANEGIRVSRIVETLRTDRNTATNERVQGLLNSGVGDIKAQLPILFRNGISPPDLLLPRATAVPALAVARGSGTGKTASTEANMARRLITITLAVDEDGSVSVHDQGAAEAGLFAEAAAPKKKLVVDAPVEPEEDWIAGYDPGFLGPDVPAVSLPTIDAAWAGHIAPLLKKSVYNQPAPDDGTAAAGVLNYRNYSVVMHKDRRVAFFSAANIDGGVEFSGLSRPPDRWLWDDRIERKHQIGNDFYAKNKIDRGHLTRREDLEWGVDPVDATRRANGTCTWPNCSPQHELFNQDKHPDKAIRLWHGLERYILEQTARQYRFKVQSFTGPVFGEFDPEYRGVKIPLDYWKVVVAVDANDKLFATGYVLSQRDVLDVTKLDEAALEVPFGKFQTYQRPLAEIEEATGLTFADGTGQSLSAVDPLAKELAKPVWRRRSPGQASEAGAEESFAVARLGNEPLDSFDQIMLG
jgi:endonuclease G